VAESANTCDDIFGSEKIRKHEEAERTEARILVFDK
jgi:hypothetical protein